MRNSLIAATMVAMLATAAGAQTQVIVTPSNPQGWQTAVYGSGTGSINSNYPRSGAGSGYIYMADAGSNEVDHYIDFANPQSLGDMSRLVYDWYRASSSTTGDWLNPAFAIHMSNGTNSDYLVYEWTYNHSGAAPTDSWITEDILGGNFWRGTNDNSATGNCATYGMFTTLAAFNTQCYGGTAQFIGFDVFMGNSIPGSFEAGFDNVTYAIGNDPGTNYNFEPDAVVATPEPASLALLATGLLALVPAARRRKRA